MPDGKRTPIELSKPPKWLPDGSVELTMSAAEEFKMRLQMDEQLTQAGVDAGVLERGPPVVCSGPIHADRKPLFDRDALDPRVNETLVEKSDIVVCVKVLPTGQPNANGDVFVMKDKEDVIATYEYFDVVAQPQKPHRKTRDYLIKKSDGFVLGQIVFHAPWRQHVLILEPHTIWSKGCMEDVNVFLAQLKEKK